MDDPEVVDECLLARPSKREHFDGCTVDFILRDSTLVVDVMAVVETVSATQTEIASPRTPPLLQGEYPQ